MHVRRKIKYLTNRGRPCRVIGCVTLFNSIEMNFDYLKINSAFIVISNLKMLTHSLDVLHCLRL